MYVICNHPDWIVSSWEGLSNCIRIDESCGFFQRLSIANTKTRKVCSLKTYLYLTNTHWEIQALTMGHPVSKRWFFSLSTDAVRSAEIFQHFLFLFPFLFPSLSPLCLINKTLGLRGLMQFDGQAVSILNTGEQAPPTH